MHKYLLDNFGMLLTEASGLQTRESDDPLSLKAAVIGFSLYYDILGWGRDEFEYVNRFLTEDPKPTDFNTVKNGKPGFEAFLCLGLGALCGTFAAGNLTGEEVGRQEWYLIAFTCANNAEICRRYDEFTARPVVSMVPACVPRPTNASRQVRMKKLIRPNAAPGFDDNVFSTSRIASRAFWRRRPGTGRRVKTLAVEQVGLSKAERVLRARRKDLIAFVSSPSSLAEVEEAEHLLRQWLCEHSDDEKMRRLSPALALFREAFENEGLPTDCDDGKKELTKHGVPVTRRNVLQFNFACWVALMSLPVGVGIFGTQLSLLIHRMGGDGDYSASAHKLFAGFFLALAGLFCLLWLLSLRTFPAFALGMRRILMLYLAFSAPMAVFVVTRWLMKGWP